jgi:hypothetical protein
MSSVDFVAKVKEGLAIVMDACEEYLERQQGQDMMRSHSGDGPTWDPNKVHWMVKSGERGPFEIADLEPDNPDYKAMQEDLRGHNGKLNKEGFFYWFFPGADTVGRKKKA